MRLKKITERRKKEIDEALRKKCDAEKDLPYARIIWEWITKFKASPEGKRSLDIIAGAKCGNNKLLNFFEWHHHDWGYDLCMAVEEYSFRLYRFGPGGHDWYSGCPEQLTAQAQEVPAGILKACCEAIENGEVYNWIAKRLNFMTGPFLDDFLISWSEN